MIGSKVASRWWHGVIAAVIVVSLVIQLVLLFTGGADANSGQAAQVHLTGAALVAWPLLWLVYIFVQGAFTRWYPYPFLDAVKLGTGGAIRNALLLAVLFALLFKLLDRKLKPLPS